MFSYLSTRISERFGAGPSAHLSRTPRRRLQLPQISWPKIKIQTVRQNCQGISVTDVALTFTSWQRAPRAGNPEPKIEGTLYLVWKRKD